MNLAQDYFTLVEDYEAGNAPFPFVPMFDHFDDSESVAEELAETWKESRLKGKGTPPSSQMPSPCGRMMPPCVRNSMRSLQPCCLR